MSPSGFRPVGWHIIYEHDLNGIIIQSVFLYSSNFVLQKEKKDIPSTYLQEPNSMMKYEYDCVFFVCQKPLEDPKSSTKNENVS